jgi:hypothetical protein
MNKNPLIFIVYSDLTGSEENQFTYLVDAILWSLLGKVMGISTNGNLLLAKCSFFGKRTSFLQLFSLFKAESL